MALITYYQLQRLPKIFSVRKENISKLNISRSISKSDKRMILKKKSLNASLEVTLHFGITLYFISILCGDAGGSQLPTLTFRLLKFNENFYNGYPQFWMKGEKNAFNANADIIFGAIGSSFLFNLEIFFSRAYMTVLGVKRAISVFRDLVEQVVGLVCLGSIQRKKWKKSGISYTLSDYLIFPNYIIKQLGITWCLKLT